MHLAITQAHERVVQDLAQPGLEYRIVRPCSYFSDTSVPYDMASKGPKRGTTTLRSYFESLHAQQQARNTAAWRLHRS